MSCQIPPHSWHSHSASSSDAFARNGMSKRLTSDTPFFRSVNLWRSSLREHPPPSSSSLYTSQITEPDNIKGASFFRRIEAAKLQPVHPTLWVAFSFSSSSRPLGRGRSLLHVSLQPPLRLVETVLTISQAPTTNSLCRWFAHTLPCSSPSLHHNGPTERARFIVRGCQLC